VRVRSHRHLAGLDRDQWVNDLYLVEKKVCGILRGGDDYEAAR
jgi:hypothetical protein